jgi:hypothetical protein
MDKLADPVAAKIGGAARRGRHIGEDPGRPLLTSQSPFNLTDRKNRTLSQMRSTAIKSHLRRQCPLRRRERGGLGGARFS